MMVAEWKSLQRAGVPCRAKTTHDVTVKLFHTQTFSEERAEQSTQTLKL